MFALLGEGLESAFFPCTLVVLLPGIAVTLASRYYSTLAASGFLISLAVAAWFRLSGRGGDWPYYVVALLFLVGALLFLPLTDRLDITSTIAGVCIGVGSATLWQPCAGEAFGQLSNELPNIGGLGALKVGVYLIGLLAPLFILAALFYLLPDGFQMKIEEPMAYAGAIFLVIISFTVLLGHDDQIISKLFEWSNTTGI